MNAELEEMKKEEWGGKEEGREVGSKKDKRNIFLLVLILNLKFRN